MRTHSTKTAPPLRKASPCSRPLPSTNYHLLTTNRGFATLELLIAFALAVTFLVGATLVSFGGQTSNLDVALTTHGLYRMQSDFGSSTAAAAVLWDKFTDAATTSDIYAMQSTVTDISPCMKQVGDVSNWTSEKNRGQYFDFTTLVANVAAAKAMGGGCNPFPPSGTDWHDPELLTSVPRAQLGNVDTNDIDIVNSILYIASGGTAANKPDIVAEDVRNILPVPPGTGLVDGDRKDEGVKQYSAIDVARNSATGKTYAYVYVGNDATTDQFQVIDVSDPYTIPTPASAKVPIPPSTPANGGGAIYFYKDKVYIGMGYNVSNPELQIFDVSAPLSPSPAGSYDVNHNIYKIIVRDQLVAGVMKTLAYAALSASSGSPELVIYDVTNPASINPIGNFNPPGNQYGLSLYLLGNKAYLGREGGANPNFYIVDVSDPTNPTSCPTCHTANTLLPYSEDVNDVTVSNNFAFLATSNALRIFNVKDPTNIVRPLTSPNGVYMNAFTAVALDSGRNLVYAAHQNQGNIAFFILYPAGFGYTLSNTGNITVTQGSSGSNTITRTLSFGAPSNVNLTASGLPAGATATFTNNPCTPTCSSVLTITTTFPTTPAGTYPIAVTGGATPTTFNLVVNPQPFDYSLTNSGNITVTQGALGNNTITNTLITGSTQPITLSASGLPTGATANFNNSPCSPTCANTLTINTTAATPVGTYPIIITGSPNGTGPRTTQFNLVVNSAVFDYSLSASPGNLIFTRTVPGTETITITKIGPAAALPVTITLSGVSNPVSSAPASRTCTPSAGSCQVTFTISISSNANKTGTITVNGSAPVHTTTFNFVAN